MSDNVSGVKNIKPTYPVKPVQPTREDRKSGKRQKDLPERETESDNYDDDQNKPSIDEYI